MSYLLTYELAHGGWYSDLSRYAFYAERIANLKGRLASGTMLIAGMGFGYLVDEAIIGGYTAYGVDLSQYAVDEAKIRLPHIASRLLLGDCRSATSMATIRQQTLGGPSSRRFSMIVTEDLLTAQENDAEVAQCLSALRSILAPNGSLICLETCRTDWTIGYESPQGLWHTGEEWKALVGDAIFIRAQDLLVF